MSQREEKPSIWTTILNLLIALFDAIRRGFTSLADSIRRALAQYNYAYYSYA